MRFTAPLLLLLTSTAAFCQDLGTRNIVLQEITIPNMPGLQLSLIHISEPTRPY